jgi:hypothetical protein
VLRITSFEHPVAGFPDVQISLQTPPLSARFTYQTTGSGWDWPNVLSMMCKDHQVLGHGKNDFHAHLDIEKRLNWPKESAIGPVRMSRYQGFLHGMQRSSLIIEY